MPVRTVPLAAAPVAVLILAFTGALAALAGGFWDDSWHTERGRDTFFVAPHIAIYAGITLVGASLAAWTLRAWRRGGVAAAASHPPLRLAALGVVLTLASALIDNAWHQAFGRDAVIWSPPHMLGIAGTMALAVALLAELVDRRQRWAPAAAALAGGAVVAAAAFTTVEYDTDVPQFATVWFLPALSAAAAVGLGLVRAASGRRWAATEAAAIHFGFMLLVSAFLATQGFALPALPLLVGAAIVLDVATRRSWPAPVTAVPFVLALVAAHLPVRNLLTEGVRFEATDLLLGAPLGWVAVTLVLAAAGLRLPAVRVRPVALTLAVTALLLVPAVPDRALGHDPGQGPDAGALAVALVADGPTISATVDLRGGRCDELAPLHVTARRGGMEVRGPLVVRGCRATGTLRVRERGRWFVYVELRRRAGPVEAWLPIVVDGTPRRVADARRFAYVPQREEGASAKVAGGVALYAVMVGLVGLCFREVRRVTATRAA